MDVSAQNPTNAWLMDSGATHHITSDLQNMKIMQPYHGTDSVLIGDGSGLSISHTGSLSLPTLKHQLQLNNILCVPNIKKSLISVYRLCNANKVSVEFFPAYFQVKELSSGLPLFQGKTNDELYEWPTQTPNLQSFYASASPKPKQSDWHFRLGHPSSSILQSIVSSFSLPVANSVTPNTSCSDCAINKTHKFPFAQSPITSTKPLQYIFSDLWTSPILSIDNIKYYLVLVDHYTRYTWICPLKTKSQTLQTFKAFKTLVKNKFCTKIGTLFSDNGVEF